MTLEAIKCDCTLVHLAEQFDVQCTQISTWNDQLLEAPRQRVCGEYGRQAIALECRRGADSTILPCQSKMGFHLPTAPINQRVRNPFWGGNGGASPRPQLA